MVVKPGQILKIAHFSGKGILRLYNRPSISFEKALEFADEVVEHMSRDLAQQTLELRKLLRTDSDPNDAQTERLKSVGYMELPTEAEGFVCKACRFYSMDRSYCAHESVRTTVSGGTGCCNLFYPATRGPTPSAKWKAVKMRGKVSPPEKSGKKPTALLGDES